MAFTETDLVALEAAIKSGELSVRDSSGRMVTYQSMDDLLRARRVIRAELDAAAGARRRTRVTRVYQSGRG